MTISGQGKVAGVIGWPVGHSLSPRLHNYWLAEHGIDGAYVPLPVRPEDISEAVRALPRLGLRGANVTIPHKQAVIAACDRVVPTARRIGAVNTLVVADDGAIEGSNTDAFGFVEALRAGAPSCRLDGATATVLGAGGASRAVIVALLDAGVGTLRLVNRTRDRADALADEFGDGRIRVADWEARQAVLEGASVLVNTTSLGMTGAAPLEIDLAPLSAGAVVMDIVYAPLETPLLAGARALGHTGVDGLGMLLHQARPGFEAWFGARPEVTGALRAHVLAGR